jgi:hypothetical protein
VVEQDFEDTEKGVSLGRFDVDDFARPVRRHMRGDVCPGRERSAALGRPYSGLAPLTNAATTGSDE